MSQISNAGSYKLGRFVSVMLAFFLSFYTGDSLGQAKSYQLKIEQRYKTKINETLVRYISEKSFSTRVVVDPDKSVLEGEKIPYLGSSDSMHYIHNANIAELGKLIKSISVTITIAEEYSKKDQKILGQIISDRLSFENENKLTIEFTEAAFGSLGSKEEVESPKTLELKKELEKLENELEKTEKEREKLERNNSDIKSKISDLENEKRSLANDLKSAKKDGEKLEKELNLIKNSLDLMNILKKNIPTLAGIILLGIALFLVIIFLLRFGKTLAAGLKSIGGGLEALGQLLISKPEKSDLLEEEPKDKPDASPGEIGISPSEIAQKLYDVMEKIKHSMSPAAKIEILSLVSEYKSQESYADMVATLEVCGLENAAELYEDLPTASKQAVTGFLQNPVFPLGKDKQMLAVGEIILSRILSSTLDELRSKQNGRIKNLVINITTDELADFALGLEQRYLQRLFANLDATQAAGLLSSVGSKDLEKYGELSGALAGVVEGIDDAESDDYLVQSLEALIEAKNANTYGKWFGYFGQILDSMDNDLTDTFINHLGSNDQELAQFLAARHISPLQVFQIPKDHAEAILDELSNQLLAALYTSYGEQLGERLTVMLSERRMTAVTAEVDRIAALDQAAVDKIKKNAQDVVIKALKKYRKKTGWTPDVNTGGDHQAA